MSTLVENFSDNTGQFATYGVRNNAPGTITFASGMGQITTATVGFGQGGTLCADTEFQPSSANLFISGRPDYTLAPAPVAPSGNYYNYNVGLYKDGNNFLVGEFGITAGTTTEISFDVLLLVSGTQYDLSAATITSAPPDNFGIGLQGNSVTVWLSFGGVWQSAPALTVDVSAYYDFTAAGALTGWFAGVGIVVSLAIPSPGFMAFNLLTLVQPFVNPTASVTVPNVVGEDQTQAQTDIEAANLNVGTITLTFSGSVPAGDVVSQTPAAGSSVNFGSAVDLVISSGAGDYFVPNILNVSEASAKTEIIAAGLSVGLISFVPDVITIPGNVSTQYPSGGSEVGPLFPVNIAISTGRAGLTVPDLFGLTAIDASNLLTSLGLVVGPISYVPSADTPAGEVSAQNPTAGNPVASGTIVSFIVSTGVPATSQIFDFEQTVISQYANSPTLLQLVSNMNQYLDQSANFANFYNYVWNIESAQGFGLDILGKIVGVSRLLRIPNSTPYVGFDISSESQPDQDWTPAGSSQDSPPVGGAFYSGQNATESYLLSDDSYRQLILAKAFANICATTAPAINQILQNLYGAGTAWVSVTGVMAIAYNFNFTPTPIQLAILQQSGVIPTPPAVAVSIVTP